MEFHIHILVLCQLCWIIGCSISSAAECKLDKDFIGAKVTSTAYALILTCIVLFVLLVSVISTFYCLYKRFIKKMAVLQSHLDEATAERKQAKSFANALTGAYETNVDAARIRKDIQVEARNAINEDYRKTDAYINSDLPEDLRADTGTFNAKLNILGSIGVDDDEAPILDTHRIVSNENDLLSNQVIVPALSDVMDELQNGGGPPPMSMSSVVAVVPSTSWKEQEMLQIQQNSQQQQQQMSMKQRVASESPPHSPSHRNKNKFDIARAAVLAREKQKKKNGKHNNNNNNNNIQNNNNNNIPAIPPIPDVPPVPNMYQQQQLPPQPQAQGQFTGLMKPNLEDIVNYDRTYDDNAAAAAGALSSIGSHESDDDIILPPNDGSHVLSTGAPPPGQGLNGKVLPPKRNNNKNNNHLKNNNNNNNQNNISVAMGLAMRISVDEGNENNKHLGEQHEVEGMAKSLKARNSDLLAINDEDDMFDDMYAPANNGAGGGAGDGGDEITTPGGLPPGAFPGGPPPKPIVEDDEIDVLDV